MDENTINRSTYLLDFSRTHREGRMATKSSLNSFKTVPWTNRTAGHDNQHILRCWHQLCPELHEYSAFFPQVMTSPSNSSQELNLVNFVSGPKMESLGGERPLQCLTHPESSNSRQKGNYPLWTFISSWIAGCGWLACLSYIQFRPSQAR